MGNISTSIPDERKQVIRVSRRRLIGDIRPPLPERVAIVEHEQADTEAAIADLQYMLGKQASHREMVSINKELEKRIDDAHLRIDRDVLPDLKELRNHATVKSVITITALIISTIANIVFTYHYLNINIKL